VSVTISLTPEYVRQQAESRHTAAAFARMPAVQQQAVLADIERAVGRSVRERVSAILPGTTPEERLARVQVVSHLTVAADQSGSTREQSSRAENGTPAAQTDRFARWGIVGVVACLTVWTLHCIVRAVRGRRSSPIGGSLPVPVAPVEPAASSAEPDRVAQLLASMEQMDGAGWARDVAHEPPQVIAALLKVLPPDRVSRVLAGLSADVQSKVLALLACVGTTRPAATPLLQTVRRQAPVPRVDRRETEDAPGYRGWFQRRRRVGPEVSEAEWRHATVAEDASHLDLITELDPVSLRTRYVELPVDVWSTALMGASSAFRVRLLSALPAADAAALRQALTRQRPARLCEIETAQSQVLALLNGRPGVAVGAL
jgi:hypothetical protein